MNNQDNACEICYDGEIERVLPCKHLLCSKCFKCINKCPFCRNPNINMKSILAEFIKDYNGLYDKEYDNDMRDDYTFAYYIFHFVDREGLDEEGDIKLRKRSTVNLDLYKSYTQYVE